MVGVSEQKLYLASCWPLSRIIHCIKASSGKNNAQNMISCNVSRRTNEEITEVDLLQSSSMKRIWKEESLGVNPTILKGYDNHGDSWHILVEWKSTESMEDGLCPSTDAQFNYSLVGSFPMSQCISIHRLLLIQQRYSIRDRHKTARPPM